MTTRANIACLGAGRMGRGIAVAFAYAGHDVAIVDFKPRDVDRFAALEAEALGEIRKTFASLSRFGLLSAADVETLMARVSVVPESAAAAALSSAAIVFEGVPEVLDLKREALARASQLAGPAAYGRLMSRRELMVGKKLLHERHGLSLLETRKAAPGCQNAGY